MLKKAVIIFIGAVVVGLVVFWGSSNREETTPITLTTNQGKLDRQAQDVIEPVGQLLPFGVSDDAVSDAPTIGDEEGGSLGGQASQPQSQNDENPNLFFVTERDFVRVHTYWEKQHDRYGSGWVGLLESELSRDDRAPNSRDLEEAAAYAVIRDPMFGYDPPLSVSDLRPSCRNYVCKVEIPTSVRVTDERMAVRVLPGSILNTTDSVVFTHGFGFRLWRHNRITNKTTHFFLANGFELNEPH